MNYLDIILGLFLVWAGYKGFRNGFIIELTTLAALLLGIFGTIKFSAFTASFLSKHLNVDGQMLLIISFILTFIVIVILVNLVGRSVHKLVEAIALGFVNRFFGLIFALLKVAFILSILINIFNWADEKYTIIDEDVKNESLLWQPVKSIAPMLFPYFNITMDQHSEDEFHYSI